MRAPARTIDRARRLRQTLSLPEILLWQALRGAASDGLRFRRQHPVGPYVLDFYAPQPRLAVEVDGAAHDHPEVARRDAVRDIWLDGQGIRVLRVNASDVLDPQRREDVLATIVAAARKG